MSIALPLAEPVVQPAVASSFEALFAQHAPFAGRALRRLGVREADLDDLVQEVFLVVHRRLATFDGRCAVSTWVYAICIRVASDYRRRAHRTRERPLDEAPEGAVPPEQDTELDRRRALAWLDAVLDTLDDDKRAVFVLFEIERVPMTEVAAAAGCPLQTAYGRLYAARKHVEAAARREQAKRSPR
ncbi:RNA polymerase sigma factor RpoE [Minicystis rosea]|nr:RNA polymerase sigma factor RpoE [Minicystis rosea]